MLSSILGEASVGKTPAPMKKSRYMAVVAMAAVAFAGLAWGDESAFDRVIHLQGTTNTRDIGGYQTNDRRTLRWRQIIRSENLSRLTESDFRQLEELSVKTVIDLRTQREHEQAPTVWQGDHPPQFYHFPIGDAHNDWFNAQRKLVKKNRFTEEESLEHMVEGYRMFAHEGPASLQQMMDLVLDQSNWPILIHCSAGKDRAGVAAALIMEALGVDRETIMEDFMLTNEVGRSEAKAVVLSRESKKIGSGRNFGKGPSPEAWFPIVGVRPQMLEAFYASVEEQYGSMEAFLIELGVDPDARMALAASLTTDQPEWAANKLMTGE
jgi:protein-tyrosine phosphatase